MLNITSGKRQRPQKVVIYGPEGIGKTTFASAFPDPVFIDTEGSTYHMDVRRTNKPESWVELVDIVKQFKFSPGICKTLVLDTADWAEMLCTSYVCDKYQKKGIEDFGYGKGYTYLQEEFGLLLNALEDVICAGMNVVVTAHAKMRKFEQPDEMGSYDRWEMKLTKQVAPMVKEWADMVLFANYKTFAVAVDDKGKKYKAQGGKRVMYTTHHPCWDAKNRQSLPDELPLDYSAIASCIGQTPADSTKVEPPENTSTMQRESKEHDPVEPEVRGEEQPNAGTGIPSKLLPLMESSGISESEVRQVFSGKGYYPIDTPWEVLESEGFVNGWIIPHWDKITEMVIQNREDDDLPFLPV